MGIKEHDIATIKPFEADICHSSSLNGWRNNDSSAVNAVESSQSSNQRQRQRRPDRAVYVPRGRRSQTTPPSAQVNNSSKIPAQNDPTLAHNEPTPAPDQVIEATEDICVGLNDRKSHQNERLQSPATAMPKLSNGTSQTASDKDYNEDKEFQRASKEINRRNRRIIKQTFDSDVLEINDKSSPPTESHLLKKPNLPQADVKSNRNASKKSNDKSAVSPDTDDWETLFDDNGECLDPKLVDEITASVGKVTITKPKSDYKSYQDPVNLEDEEFPHVLEVSNFPIEFKTQDLMQIFSEYKDTGFDIKWVDDTHALVVFSSSKIAARVLNEGHAFVKLKPLTQSTAESRARAKKSALFLQPYRQRPETCAALARRLVTGALGVRLSTAREELENERRVLREAKERKMLAAKLRDEAWEN